MITIWCDLTPSWWANAWAAWPPMVAPDASRGLIALVLRVIWSELYANASVRMTNEGCFASQPASILLDFDEMPDGISPPELRRRVVERLEELRPGVPLSPVDEPHVRYMVEIISPDRMVIEMGPTPSGQTLRLESTVEAADASAMLWRELESLMPLWTKLR